MNWRPRLLLIDTANNQRAAVQIAVVFHGDLRLIAEKVGGSALRLSPFGSEVGGLR